MTNLKSTLLYAAIGTAMLLSGLACNSKEDAKTNALDSVDGVKWGTPYNEALKYLTAQKHHKKSPDGDVYVVQSMINYRGLGSHSILILRYDRMGIQGRMVYNFSVDSTSINNKPGRFKSASFIIEGPDLNRLTHYNYKTEYEKFRADANRLDSMYISQYGKYNHPWGGKAWKWPGKSELSIDLPEDYKTYASPEGGSVTFNCLDYELVGKI